MANANRNTELFFIKPTIAALAVAFTGGSVQAADEPAKDEASTLPEVKVAAPKEKSSGYKAEKASSSKFTESLQDTPKSITVITDSVIKDTGSATLAEALRTVPGITFGAAEGGGAAGDRPFIRGFDSQSAMYVDGVRSAGGQTRETFAIDSIEVIKGPSGAYDGRGSAGGSINLVTKQPKAENFISGSVGLGTDQYRRVTLDGNYAVNEDIAVRVAVLSHTADTPGRDDVDMNKFGFAPSITFGMNSPTSLNLSYYHLNTDEMPDYGLPLTSTIAGVTSKANPRKPASVDRDNFYGYASRDFRKTQIDSGTATFKHVFNDDLIFKNVTRYDVSTNDYIVTNPDDSRGNVSLRGTVQRSAKSRNSLTRAISNISDLSVAFDTWNFSHKLNTGIEVSHEQTNNRPYVITMISTIGGTVGTVCNATSGTNCTSLENPNPSDPFTGTIADSPTLTTSRAITKSAYVFDSVELTKQWIASAGLRYDDYETDVDTFNRATNARTELGQNRGFWNYQAGLVYKPQPNVSVYTSWGTSSTPSGTTVGTGADNIALATQDLEPERSRSTELGVKWTVLEDLMLNAAIFRIEKTNARVTGDIAGTTINGGDMQVKGFEVGAAGKITSNWQTFAGYTYLDSEVVDGGPSAAGILAKGNDFANTPKNSASLWTTYALTPKLTIGGGAYYVDKQYGTNAMTVVIPSYTRLDAMASYQIDKNLDLRLNIQNLTDERYFSSVFTTHYAVVAPGRVGMLTLNFKY